MYLNVLHYTKLWKLQKRQKVKLKHYKKIKCGVHLDLAYWLYSYQIHLNKNVKTIKKLKTKKKIIVKYI